MSKITFKQFLEVADIFGFERKQIEKPDIEDDYNPIRQFDVELMMNYLKTKKVGFQEAESLFVTEVVWGQNPGSLKVEIDTGYTIMIKKFNFDLEGNRQWAVKKMFQINRRGIAGMEDIIANEVYHQVNRINNSLIDYPKEDFKDTQRLVRYIGETLKKTAKPYFIWKGITKFHENAYEIIFECGGQGVGVPDGHRLEQNVTQVIYEQNKGIIKVKNYNIESSLGGNRTYNPQPADLDLTFFPTQTKEEIGDCIAVFFKYY